MSGPVAARLPDGRLHLQHGPIDLVIAAWGENDEIRLAYGQAWDRFQDVLQALVDELPGLRTPVGAVYPLFRGPVARRMAAAVWPHRAVFVTPMAAVAGAVADEILTALRADRTLRKAYVNNGGDIAIWLATGESLRAGVVADVDAPAIDAVATIGAGAGIGGLATSGWRGRSQSFGIADAVTVLAEDAAAADAAATLAANAVNIDHPAIKRRPASAVQDDSDLGDRLVTVAVDALPVAAINAALDNGTRVAESMRRQGLIRAAYLTLQGQVRSVGAAARNLAIGNGGRG